MYQIASRMRVVPRRFVARPSYFPAAQRLFSNQARMLLKEDAHRSPEEVEKLKQEQLAKQKRGEGHWHEELASAGESAIAADKEKVHDHDEHIEELQKKTAGDAEKKK